MFRVRVMCKNCKFYSIEGISERCTKERNTYHNWLGMMYKKHPTDKNLRGRCKDHEEEVT
jgi:hypothetical protein